MAESLSDRLMQAAQRMLAEAGARSWEFVESHSGQAHLSKKIIHCPPPTTLNRLHVLAHECGHLALNHRRRSLKSHRMEYEAERYAIRACIRHGFQVPPSRVAIYQRHVERSIASDLDRRRLTEIDEEAYRWAEPWIRDEIRDEVESGGVELCPPFKPIPARIIELGWFPEEFDVL